MKNFLLIVSALLIGAHSYTQHNQWTVKAGENIKEVLGDSVIFQYPQFMPGSVYFKDKTVSIARFNLNLVNGEMQFIDLSEDTMTLDNESTIQYIIIQTDTFYYDKVYVNLIHGNAIAKLAKVVAIVPGDIQKVGGYGQASSTSSINSSSYFYNGNQIVKLNEDKIITLHKRTIYFIGDNFNHFLPVNKENIHSMFTKQKLAIDNFIKENKIVLDKEADLLKLIDFLEKE